MIDIHDLAKLLSDAKVKNTIFLLDVCYSGGAGAVLGHLDLNLNPDTNIFVIGAARHDQVTVQSSTLQHGVFTSCLLQAFEQKPRRTDGWLTITDILSFVTEAIQDEANKLSGIESPVQIQQQSASVNPNLLFVKNPHYSPQSLKFHRDVEVLLELLQYEPIETADSPEAPTGFYIAEIKSGLRTYRVGVVPFYNKVEYLTFEEAEKIAHFIKGQVEQGNLDEGLLVTEREVSKEVKDLLQKSGTRLDVRTCGSIWKDLIDFNKYLRKLVDEYQTPVSGRVDDLPLAKVYIPLRAVNPRDVEEMRFIGKPGKMYLLTQGGDLEEAVKRWLSDTDPSTSRLALLADYGSGKSTFCQHLAAKLAEDYLASQGHGHFERRIPLLIPLRDFGKNPVDLKAYLASYLKLNCRVRNADPEALMKMAEAGLLLFILDGFDEMASRATNDTIRLNIEQFEELANIRRNKVLLTTRPEYFLNLYQEQQVLQAYPRLYLQSLDKEQVNNYLQKRVPLINTNEGESKKDWTYYRQQIDRIHDLTDLVRRPVLLEMVIRTLPVLVKEGESINRPNLYQRYLEGELDRQIIKQRRDLLIDRKKRFEIMERIAVELYRTDKTELTSYQILQASKELLTAEQQEEMEGSLREIVTCSFLIRTGNEYRFSHQSFLEYLVARRLAKDIMSDKQENLQLKLLTLTIRDFLSELQREVVQGTSSTAYTNNASVSFDRKWLESWFRTYPRDKWLSTNAISLLARILRPDQLLKLPLGEADLTAVDLRRANLSGANLAGTDLTTVILTSAILTSAILTSAILTSAILTSANLIQANLERANLERANLERANLERANLIQANLRDTNLIRANLSGADLSGADLSGADLSGANLSGANLFSANLLRAKNLEEADLFGANLQGAYLDKATRRKLRKRT